MVTMTKKEFHGMVKSEIEILVKERDYYKGKVDFYTSLKREREKTGETLSEEEEKELKDLEFEIDILERDIKGLKDLVGVELIEEIKARPDEQIDKNFREEEIANAIHKINEIEKELSDEQKKLDKIKEAMDELKGLGGNAENIKEYQRLFHDREQKELDIASIKKKLEEQQKWLEKIPHLSIEEIRELLINRIYTKQDNKNLKIAVEKLSREDFLPRYGREKAGELSSQIKRYVELDEQRDKLAETTGDYRFNTLPYQARDKILAALGIKKNDDRFDAKTPIPIDYLNRLKFELKDISEYIKAQLRILNHCFVLDERHILPLIGIDFDGVKYKANIDVNNQSGQITYFYKHANAFTTADDSVEPKVALEFHIESLKELYQKRDELQNGKFAFLNKSAIEAANNAIRDYLFDMYLKVYNYYVNGIINTKYFENVSIHETKVRFCDEQTAKKTISKLKETIETFKKAADNMLEQVEEQIKNYNHEYGKITGKKWDIENKIDNNAAMNILREVCQNPDSPIDIDDEIKDGISLTRQKDILDDIRKEAKEQVLVSDYELQLMPLDALLALKQELKDKWNAGRNNDDTQYGDSGTGKRK